MFRVHFGAFQCADHHIGGAFGAMAPLCRSTKPVILFRRQKHKLAATVPGYLNRLALRLMLEPSELALKLE